MSENKHTPGPWEWEVDGQNYSKFCLFNNEITEAVLLPQIQCIHCLGDITHGAVYLHIDVSEADARLIAAAPSRLDACKMVMETEPQERMNDTTLAYVSQAIALAEQQV